MIDQSTLDEVALSREEYDLIVQRLGREPNQVELGLFGSLWSEHCGYKNSKPLLRLFPTEGEHVLVEAGKENAGAVYIGDGLAIVMKVESHNHPSAIEPYQGAATGVGGIVRDIFAMGARPIALLNSLRFGPLTEPRNRYLFVGVVGGIAGYGNCLGIPNVGGEVVFDPSYSGNPLVNAMCVGLVEATGMVRAVASGPGNLLMLVGADTGRDGIHGASGLASRTFEEERELRSTVQVGNPFMEKLLLEACLELVQTDWLVGLQDLGAAGLTSSAIECAAKGGVGIEIDVLRVPRRETGMTPYEVMLSESQERMLVVVRKGYEGRVKMLFDKWDLQSTIIGQVIEEPVARIKEGDQVVAEAPVALLTDPPLYRRQGHLAPEILRLQQQDLSQLPDAPPRGMSWADALLALLAAPNIASKRSVYRQYDHQVLINTAVAPGSDAAVLRIKGTRKGIALANDGNGRLCYLDPYVGGAIAVAEAARNVVCMGAQPIALTNCLNFGNPERLEVYYQLEESIKGMSAVCQRLRVPVISGNVSLYNESAGQAIYPTPVVGMLGLLDDIDQHATMGFKAAGDVVYLLGADLHGGDGTRAQALAGSEYLAHLHGLVAGRPELDLELEVNVQRLCLDAIQAGWVRSAHDCSDGGLAVALAECCIAGNLGLEAREIPAAGGRVDSLLFGEQQSRIVVSVAPEHGPDLEQRARAAGVPITRLGAVAGERMMLGAIIDLPISQLAEAWEHGLERALGGDHPNVSS
ncbi:MAG TPA: phosphoribosylformylglycinamidine synthase subunit PurL [Dehalococcoidia bacterium]|nr:phosphoribosylformylglycinamidine synthase subunit PurL [Dehalococcoidia bacterium]